MKKVSAEALERRRVGRLKAAETMARKIKKSGIERRDNRVKYSVFDNVHLINQKNYFTDYLKKDEQVYILRERKLLRQGNLKKHDEKGTSMDEDKTPLDEDDEAEQDDEEEEESEDEKVVVIHPGSKNIRIGLASDVYPKTFPFVVASPETAPFNSSDDSNGMAEDIEEYQNEKKGLVRDFKERMKYYKRRIIPNSNDIVANFNKKVQPETIPEHNDVHRLEFLKPKGEKFFIGADAMRVPNGYRLRYPLITSSKFNEKEYASFLENIGEIQLFLSETLQTHFEISNLKQYKATLIIPDLYDRVYVESFIELLLQMGFNGVAIIQESLSATYGAGVSSACVIDIGAQSTKVACVDDGLILPSSRVSLSYGGDDITKFFYSLLQESSFPMAYDFKKPYEWRELEQLKEKFITFTDANVTVQLYNFMKRYPDKLSEKYEFKVFDEVILAPMALFFPKMFKKTLGEKYTTRQSVDIYSGESNNPKSGTQKDVMLSELYSDMLDLDIVKKLNQDDEGVEFDTAVISPLDKAIIQSITNAAREDYTKLKSFYANLLIVGGGSKIESLDFILTDRINIWRPKLLAIQQLPEFIKQLESIVVKFEKEHEMSKQTDDQELDRLQHELDSLIEQELNQFLEQVNTIIPVEVLPSPRDIDPSVLTWKGGSVYSRLKLIQELWITERDWDLLGSRVLQHKSLWNY
jgi:actin-related protein 8